jgi:hypothetical protein
MSFDKASEKQMHTNRKKHAETDTLEMEEHANSNDVITWIVHPINNGSAEEQVCIYV